MATSIVIAGVTVAAAIFLTRSNTSRPDERSPLHAQSSATPALKMIGGTGVPSPPDHIALVPDNRGPAQEGLRRFYAQGASAVEGLSILQFYGQTMPNLGWELLDESSERGFSLGGQLWSQGANYVAIFVARPPNELELWVTTCPPAQNADCDDLY